ncbi:MAG TPA: KTSC domain-containing protein [Steroidobacteraceae bacterium]|jgi:lysyl-tRNA synthetase class 2|nr:KTSC domain-containing protein [Steroidobacteraceae bacterium]
MPSNVIRWFNYSSHSRELLIGFRSGREYAYLDVPENVYLAMKRAFSKGEFFNLHVRDRYRFVQRRDHNGADLQRMSSRD